MLNLLENIVPADLVTFARSVPLPDDYLLTREVVPNATIDNVKYRIKNFTKFGSTAKFRAYDAETPLGRREVAHRVTEGFLPPVGQKLFVGELETILLSLERGADDQDLVDALYDDTEANVRAIRARMELAAGDLLTDGKFTLTDENGLTLEADFGVAAGFLPTAATYWSDPDDATPLDDEQAWIQYLVDNGAGRPGRAMTSQQIINLWGSSMQYKEAYFGRNQTAYPTLNPQQVNAVRATYNLPPVIAYDTQVRVDGVNTRVTPANRYFLLPASSDQFAETQYGITAEALTLARTGNPRLEREDLPGIAVTAKEEDDPVKVWSKATANAMPLMYDNTAYVGARVLA